MSNLKGCFDPKGQDHDLSYQAEVLKMYVWCKQRRFRRLGFGRTYTGNQLHTYQII
jgi:hypothetical protein